MSLPQLVANSSTPGTRQALTVLSGNSGSITNVATTMNTLAAAPAVLQAPGQFDVVIDSEVIRVTAGASGTSWTIVRGVDGSTAASHNDGASIYPYLTAGALLNMLAEAVGSIMQPGVVGRTDLLLSSISCSAGGALTFTPAATGTYPAWLNNAAGLITRVGYGGSAKTITPGTLPVSGDSCIFGVEIDTTGAITLVKGTNAVGNLAIGSLTSPAVTTGAMRIGDISVFNNSGTYQLSSTTTPTQNTNWTDRRSLLGLSIGYGKQSGAVISAVTDTPGNEIEFGHSNTAGFRSVLGAEQGSGASYVAFNCFAGTTNNTYKTVGNKGALLRGDNNGGVQIFSVTNANADNQTPSQIAAFTASGGITVAAINGVLVPTSAASWTTPSFVNSWVDAGGCRYLKDALGFVHLRGSLSTGTSGTTAFTLPAGFRPGITDYYMALQGSGVAGCYVNISTAGVVVPTYTVASTVFINGITFLAEN